MTHHQNVIFCISSSSLETHYVRKKTIVETNGDV